MHSNKYLKKQQQRNLILNAMKGWMVKKVAYLFVQFACKPFLLVWKEKMCSFQICMFDDLL